MGFEQAFVFGILFLTLIALAFDLWSPDAVLLTALGIVTAAGIIDLKQAAQSFGNSTLLALGSLYVVAAALRNSGALERAGQFILGEQTSSIRRILLRMCPPVTIYSAFLNNTPIVAMGIPAIRKWANRHQVAVSKLLMPLSFAAILGGICTLIGTSTNLITHGLLQNHGYEGLSFFELAWLGVPCAILGLIYIIFLSPHITPVRKDIRLEEEQSRQQLVELEIDEEAPVIGNTVKESGLYELPGFSLARINRDGQEIAPVTDDEVLRAGDHLLYAAKEGVAPQVPNLADYPGLRLVLQPPRAIDREEERDRELHQVVIKEGSRLVGSTVEEAHLLDRFGAAVTGVRRGGERLDQPLSELVLQPGDVLLLDTGRGFKEAHEDTGDFFMTSAAGGEAPETKQQAAGYHAGGKDLYISVVVLAGIITCVVSGLLNIAVAGILGVAVLLAFDVIEPGEARKSVDWTVLIVIGAALGLGKAMEVSGAARLLGEWIVNFTSAYGPRMVLAGAVIVTAILTNIITNNGAVALMFPIVLSIAEAQGLHPRSLFIGITLAASMSFITPIGYQTNLMVYGPGNYKFTDFFRVGAPLQLILLIVVIILAPMIWPM